MVTVNKGGLENFIKLSLSLMNVVVYLLEGMDVKGRVESCQAAESDQYFRYSIGILQEKWYQFHEIDGDENNDDEELNESDMFIESNAKKYTIKGDIAIICTGDDHNYYLTKLITDIYETEESEMDDYNHEMPAHQKVIVSFYLEVHEDIKRVPSITLHR